MPSLVEAIANKYGPDEAENFEAGIPVAIYVPKKGPRNIVPSLLVLNDCNIDSAGDEHDLCNKCKCVEELDLAQNSLTRWSEVLSILRQMPRVKFANLSFNNLSENLKVDGDDHKPEPIETEVPADQGSPIWTDVEPCPDLFPLLKNLVLNSTQIQWASVRRILRLLPNLEELHLSLNGYSTVELGQGPADVHDRVKRLHFTGNPIKHWSEVCRLGKSFPNLESLVLAECPVQSLDPLGQSSPCPGVQRLSESGESGESGESESSDDCCGSPLCSFYNRSESECESAGPKPHSAHDVFRQLRFLNLNNTLLSTWDDVDRLALFPMLHCLRIQGCPLFEFPQEYTEHERRQLLIARLPNVQTLNGGGVVSMEEREDAERAFIRYYMEKPESDRPERYTDLLHIHGRLEPLVNIDLTPEKRVKVNIVCGENVDVKSINVYQTVSELKQKLEAFSGISAPKMRLFYVDQDMRVITGPEEMKFPNKQLYSYNISSGDEIIVDSKV